MWTGGEVQKGKSEWGVLGVTQENAPDLKLLLHILSVKLSLTALKQKVGASLSAGVS